MPTDIQFKPGDKVRVIDVAADLPFAHGDVVTVAKVGHDDYVSLAEDPNELRRTPCWRPTRFEFVTRPVSAAEKIDQILPRDPEPSVLLIEPSPAHLRAYDFEAGDQRFFDRDEALNVARARVKDRGCRQQVRPVNIEPGDEKLVPRWLVQDV